MNKKIKYDKFEERVRQGLKEAFEADKISMSEDLLARTLCRINEKEEEIIYAAKTPEASDEKELHELHIVTLDKKTDKRRRFTRIVKIAGSLAAALLIAIVSIRIVRMGGLTSGHDNAAPFAYDADNTLQWKESGEQVRSADTNDMEATTDVTLGSDVTDNADIDGNLLDDVLNNTVSGTDSLNMYGGIFGGSGESKEESSAEPVSSTYMRELTHLVAKEGFFRGAIYGYTYLDDEQKKAYLLADTIEGSLSEPVSLTIDYLVENESDDGMIIVLELESGEGTEYVLTNGYVYKALYDEEYTLTEDGTYEVDEWDAMYEQVVNIIGTE